MSRIRFASRTCVIARAGQLPPLRPKRAASGVSGLRYGSGRGQIVLFGINRPYIQNRIDPETFEKLAEAYYQYDHDPSLRAAILFAHGENFSRGIDVEGFKSLAGTGKPWIASTGTIDPLAKRAPRLTKPLVAVTHGDTWNMAHELHLVADIRIASADTGFGQDENTHGRFPGGGSTVRFVREAGDDAQHRYAAQCQARSHRATTIQ